MFNQICWIINKNTDLKASRSNIHNILIDYAISIHRSTFVITNKTVNLNNSKSLLVNFNYFFTFFRRFFLSEEKREKIVEIRHFQKSSSILF